MPSASFMTHLARWRLGLALLWFAAALVCFLLAVQVGWNHTLLDLHGFRQTQTAISARYLAEAPWQLAYETPVLGPPWSIPFEFPLYQWLVAGTSWLLGCGLEPAGRLVSVVFYLLTLFPARHVLAHLGFSAVDQLIGLSMLLLSPFYVFWSRTFMIESTALFFSVSYLAAMLSFCARPRLGSFVVALVCGCLAGLVKVTTFAPFFLPAAFLAVRFALNLDKGKRHAGQRTAALSLLVVPAACALAWTRFADAQKLLNPMGASLTSAALTTWNFGTLDQRLDPETWRTLFRRTKTLQGSYIVLAICSVAMLFARARLRAFVVCCLLYLSAPLIFTNLHVVHSYYAYANGIFLIAALAICLAGLHERGGACAWLSVALLPLVLVTSVNGYLRHYYPIQRTDNAELAEICAAIERTSRPDDVILIVGEDWSPEVPYYAHRRAIMIPTWKSNLQLAPACLELARQHGTRVLVVSRRQFHRLDVAAFQREAAAVALTVSKVHEESIGEVLLLSPSPESDKAE